ncbi:uncharacterized protein [Rutidosis leptorrhynchoides]|uniref:uncharacterized protein n=1 Tax=Rutidosis leptorrhynchoides TaxID=125765 RepID=UPI003A998FDF
MMTGLIQDQNLEKQIEKQIGCMSGFLHIFDRQQILAGKRIHSTKRLTPSTGMLTSPESVKSVVTPTKTKTEKTKLAEPVVVSVTPSPDRFKPAPVANTNAYAPVTPPKSPMPLPLFEIKEGAMKNSWKFCKEMPRLSLDSRATVDSKGSLCPKEGNARSPSVIARLMGLEQLPSSETDSSRGLFQDPLKKPELRRSASESRVSRDLFHSRFGERSNGFQQNQPNKQSIEANLIVRDNVSNRNAQNVRVVESKKFIRNQKNDSQWKPHNQRKSFFDSGDFFPDSNQTSVQMYGETENHLKMKGIDEKSNDLETLKHILEALQLKGLLHSKKALNREGQRNVVYGQSFASDDPNIVLGKPWRSGLVSPNRTASPNRRFSNDFGVNRYSSESLPSISPKRDRGVVDRTGRSPIRARNSPGVSKIERNLKNCNTIVKNKPLSIETQRSFNSNDSSRRNSPINSPKLTPKRSGSGSGSGSDYQSVTNQSPRNRSPYNKVYNNFVTEDESSSISEHSGSTNSQSDPERPKMEECREGKSLLARCDKLLSSIAEMNCMTESQVSSNSVLPSPVSVLDSGFDKDESLSPSPVMKRCIDFKDLKVDLEEGIWSSIISPSSSSTNLEESELEDSDLTYIAEILRASKYLPDDAGVFYFLEKQHYLNGNESTKKSKLQRKLVFDSVAEILDRNRELPPWNAQFGDGIQAVYSEYQKICEPQTADNVLDLVCVVLKRDLAGNNGWGDQPEEMSESVLCIERLIFKDLICETILDLAEFAQKTRALAPRRKLVF